MAAIPQDAVEWKRPYGRVIKSVYIEGTFIKFDKECLQIENNWNILKRPIFHIYWTDCVDIESYKTTLRDDIEAWLKLLSQKEVTDWMIVLVETYDIRKTNKLLPRTTVLDKIRSDFASKNDDRCLSVINPIKSESRSAESWRGLVSRVRHFVLTAYNKTLIKFEEHMHEQREKRNDPEWDFSKYFLLQEQLAFVFEMLGAYEEALVQYDELDALFTQFVLNSNVTESPKWLSRFQRPIETWHSVRLGPLVPVQLRDVIVKQNASLFDFRSYLFQRQSAMLLLTFKPWEIAARCLSTVHNTIKELSLLEVNVPQGATACWALLTCMETLRTCEHLLANSSNVSHNVIEQCASHQAPLWHYAKDKLYTLGKMCGLLPGTPEPSSEQLHLVVMLSAGMGDLEGSGQQPTPTDRLKQALGSKQNFQLHYLELAELAMGTYKHIGRLRFARLIGRDLASFYAELGETGKAVVFLLDALRSYEEQGWRDLAGQTRLELVACYQKMEDYERYTKLSATIASCAELEILVRYFYFDEMMKSIRKNLKDKSSPVLCELGDCFRIVSASIVKPKRGIFITDNKIQCCLEMESLLPREVVCKKACVSIEQCKEHGDSKAVDQKGSFNSKTDVNNILGVSNQSASSSPVRGGTGSEELTTTFVYSIKLDDLKPKNPLLNPVCVKSQLHHKEDRTLDCASIQYSKTKTPLRRSDSAKYRKQSATVRNDYTHCMTQENFVIKPGINGIMLETVAEKPGFFKLGQVSLVVEEKLEYLSNALVPTRVGYEVVTQGTNVALNKLDPKKDLVAGLNNEMELVVTSGSTHVAENCTIHLSTSVGLGIQQKSSPSLLRELAIPVPACKPFQTVRVPLTLFASLHAKKDDRPVEHKVWLRCPWSPSELEVPLHFSSPLAAAWRLLTAHERKFVQASLRAAAAASLRVEGAKLSCDGGVRVVDLNPEMGENMVLGTDGTTISYMWELQNDPLVPPTRTKLVLDVTYSPLDGSEPPREYRCPFHLEDYTTLFVIKTKLEPTKGSEFCRASQMCYLQLSVQRVNETEYTSLMYEVLADQTMWAVCGKIAGVIMVDSAEPQCVTLEVMPLIAGYLPLPTVRLSKYITSTGKDGARKPDLGLGSSAHPRLEPFSSGQVYHSGKALQVHVLPSVTGAHDTH